MEIRRAEPKDYEAFFRLETEINLLHVRQEPGYFREVSAQESTQSHFDGLLANPDHAVYVAVVDGTLAGGIHVECLDSAPLPMLVPLKMGKVHEIVIAESMQRQGIGTALMHQAANWARSKGAHEMRLSVWDFNSSALKLYESLGYHSKYQTLSLPLEK